MKEEKIRELEEKERALMVHSIESAKAGAVSPSLHRELAEARQELKVARRVRAMDAKRVEKGRPDDLCEFFIGRRINMRKTLAFIVFIALLSLTGCATLPSPSQMAEETRNFTLPKQSEVGSALIYVVRPAGLGGAVRFNIFLDDKEDSSEMGYTRAVQYIYFFVSPGKHIIFSNAENWADIDINAKEGETIFLKQNPEWGILFARNSLELIGEIEGKYYVKNTEIGEIKKVRKMR